MLVNNENSNFIAKRLNFCNELMDRLGEKDCTCIYFSEVYRGVCTFVLRLTSERYLESSQTLDKAIGEFCHANQLLEQNFMDEVQMFNTILQSVDQIIIQARQNRSVALRLMGVKLIFPDYFDRFAKWFKSDYIEESYVANKENRDHVIDTLAGLSQEIDFLSKVPGGDEIKKIFLEQVQSLLK